MRRAAWGLALVVSVLLSEHARAQQASCDGVTCGGHGRCMTEGSDAFCFCDEGYDAEALGCVRAPVRPARVVWLDTAARVADIAAAEEGHDLATVGVTRSGEPGPLRAFVRGTGLWCSDFVSWVYRAAGVPFTGGYHGGWMLRNNATIRAWFERRAAWISSTDPRWRTLPPRPGDYVRVRTSTWGHSAIVRSVEGSTLVLVEGNASGRVHIVRYRDYRSHERLDGYGSLLLAHVRRP